MKKTAKNRRTPKDSEIQLLRFRPDCRAGTTLTWLLIVFGVMATLAVAVRIAVEAAESEPEREIPAMNGELAEREANLTERIRAAEPDRVELARQTIRAAAEETARALASLPENDSGERLARTVALARFRRGQAARVSAVSNALEAVSFARAAARRDAAAAAAAAQALSETLDAGLDSWLLSVRRMGDELAGWRAQRLEKTERREFATFGVFYEAASERYRDWETGFDTADALRRTLLEDLLPRAEAAVSNQAERLAIVQKQSDRAAAAYEAVRQTPIDPDLFEKARTDALSAYESVANQAEKAHESAGKGLSAETLRTKADHCRERADSLDAAMRADAADSDFAIPESVVSETGFVVSAAKAAAVFAEKAAADFDEKMTDIERTWISIKKRMADGNAIATRLRRAKRKDEESFTTDTIHLDAVRALIAKDNLPARIVTLESVRVEAESALDFAEKRLTEANIVRWAAARHGLETSLGTIRATWEASPRPGWTREPERKRKVLTAIDELLQQLGSSSEEDVRAARAKLVELMEKAPLVWTPGSRHPDRPHIFAMEKENFWDADPGYWFDNPGENSDLVVHWLPGKRHPDHPHVSAGVEEGTWTPDPGFKARWNGDLDPVWTIGTRHPNRPHVFASRENGKDVWGCDPGYVWVQPNSTNLDCHWVAGRRHPEHQGIESGQQEGTWVALPGWTRVRPGTSDLQTRWVPGSKHPVHPHIHAGDTPWNWTPDNGYLADAPGSANLSVHWEPGLRHSLFRGIVSAEREGYWEPAEGWVFETAGALSRPENGNLRVRWLSGLPKQGSAHVHASSEEGKWTPDDGYDWASPSSSDYSVVWKPGWISADGMRRAKEREGQFSRRATCHACSNGWKIRSERCSNCNGTGKVVFGLTCPQCNGTKRKQTRTVCTQCNGAGWYWP